LRQKALDAFMASPERCTSGTLALFEVVIEVTASCAILTGISGQVEKCAIGTSRAGSAIENRSSNGTALALLDSRDEDIVGGTVFAYSFVVVEVLWQEA